MSERGQGIPKVVGLGLTGQGFAKGIHPQACLVVGAVGLGPSLVTARMAWAKLMQKPPWPPLTRKARPLSMMTNPESDRARWVVSP